MFFLFILFLFLCFYPKQCPIVLSLFACGCDHIAKRNCTVTIQQVTGLSEGNSRRQIVVLPSLQRQHNHKYRYCLIDLAGNKSVIHSQISASKSGFGRQSGLFMEELMGRENLVRCSRFANRVVNTCCIYVISRHYITDQF